MRNARYAARQSVQLNRTMCWLQGEQPAALDAVAKILPAYEALFDIPFSLPKLDLVAIPDFAAGAMENWGLITYRETDLLIDPVTASIGDYRGVAWVVAHEMTHQVWLSSSMCTAGWSAVHVCLLTLYHAEAGT